MAVADTKPPRLTGDPVKDAPLIRDWMESVYRENLAKDAALTALTARVEALEP